MDRAIIKKNGRERVEVSISEFKNRKFLDIRNYYHDAASGEWKPTPKGISVPVELSKQIWKAVKSIGGEFFDLLPPNGKEKEAEDKADEISAKSDKLKKKKKKLKSKEVRADVVEASATQAKENSKKRPAGLMDEILEDKPSKKVKKDKVVKVEASAKNGKKVLKKKLKKESLVQ